MVVDEEEGYRKFGGCLLGWPIVICEAKKQVTAKQRSHKAKRTRAIIVLLLVQ